MRRTLFAVVAGIPSRLRPDFVAKFDARKAGWTILAWRDLGLSEQYTELYATELYQQLVVKLARLKPSADLTDVSLVLLYLPKGGSESTLFQKFAMEALMVPVPRPDAINIRQVTGNERGRAANALVRESVRSLKAARLLLGVIAQQVTSRANKTCLLLPPKNFGPQSATVHRYVHDAVLEQETAEGFKNGLDYLSIHSLNTILENDGFRYFVGSAKLVFKSSRRARHGRAPTWEAQGHDSCCVLRGRLRFGAPYDPGFHYDCDIAHIRPGARSFPSCHGNATPSPGRNYVNIAPNDNVR